MRDARAVAQDAAALAQFEVVHQQTTLTPTRTSSSLRFMYVTPSRSMRSAVGTADIEPGSSILTLGVLGRTGAIDALHVL
jgi:hypothetical protein